MGKKEEEEEEEERDRGPYKSGRTGSGRRRRGKRNRRKRRRKKQEVPFILTISQVGLKDAEEEVVAQEGGNFT